MFIHSTSAYRDTSCTALQEGGTSRSMMQKILLQLFQKGTHGLINYLLDNVINLNIAVQSFKVTSILFFSNHSNGDPSSCHRIQL